MTSRTRYQVPAADVIASDLIVEIVPRQSVEWIGTKAQLLDEGLVPADIIWPYRDRWVGWNTPTLECWLRRTKPLGMKGPKRLWLEVDWWALRQTLLSDRGKGHWPAAIYEKRCELQQLIWSQSEAGQMSARQWYKARADERFQSFKQRVIFG